MVGKTSAGVAIDMSDRNARPLEPHGEVARGIVIAAHSEGRVPKVDQVISELIHQRPQRARIKVPNLARE
jgi:hypothetical protein